MAESMSIDGQTARPTRHATTYQPIPDLSSSFLLVDKKTSYKHQYANIYFVRLSKLRKDVERRANEKWRDHKGSPTLVSRVLEVRKGTLCYIVGTVYMEMMMKPSALRDLSKQQGLSVPDIEFRNKFYGEEDTITLEDESGRVKLAGERLLREQIVTGIIVAVLGYESPNGEFEVLDFCYPGPGPRLTTPKPTGEDAMDVDGGTDAPATTATSSEDPGSWIAFVSGLNIGNQLMPADIRIHMLVEYLTSEGGGPEDQASSSEVSRLVIAGNSVGVENPKNPIITDDPISRRNRKFGLDAPLWTPRPTKELNAHLLDLLRCLPVHVLPGEKDPASVLLPQQGLPRAMFGDARLFEGFRSETNPCWIGLDNGCTLLGTSGQTIDDIFRYVPSQDRVQMAMDTLKWRHMAPTAPDTLWCYPYFKDDPFIIRQSPHIYFIGNQSKFGTDLYQEGEEPPTRVILIPRFSDTGVMVLVHTKTLDVKTVEFGLPSIWDDEEADTLRGKGIIG